MRELMTSISCRDTVCTTSLRFCSSPSGHCTNLVYGAKGRREGSQDTAPQPHAGKQRSACPQVLSGDTETSRCQCRVRGGPRTWEPMAS